MQSRPINCEKYDVHVCLIQSSPFKFVRPIAQLVARQTLVGESPGSSRSGTHMRLLKECSVVSVSNPISFSSIGYMELPNRTI